MDGGQGAPTAATLFCHRKTALAGVALVQVTLMAASVLACGDGGGGGRGREDDPPDVLSCEGIDGAWATDVVTDSASLDISGAEVLATEDGDIHAVVRTFDPAEAGFGMYLFTRGADGSWSAPQPIGSEYASTSHVSVVAVGDTLHAAWVRSDLEGHIDYATRSSGGSWSEPVDLTQDLKDTSMRRSRSPLLAASRDGDLRIVWGSQDRLPSIFVARIQDGQLDGEPSTVVLTDRPDTGCDTEDVTLDAAGHLQAAVSCFGERDIETELPPARGSYRVTDSGGAWESEVVTGQGRHLRLAIGSEDTVHATWIDGWNCGDDTCGETDVYYSRREEVWGEPIHVTPNRYGPPPEIAFSENAGVLIAFLSDDVACENCVSVSLTSSTDGAAFSSACAVSAPQEGQSRFDLSSMVVRPDTDLPVVSYMFSDASDDTGGRYLAVAELE